MNIFSVSTGLKKTYRTQINCEKDAFTLFIENSIIRAVEDHSDSTGFIVSGHELKALIGLQYAWGLYGRSHSIDFICTDSDPI